MNHLLFLTISIIFIISYGYILSKNLKCKRKIYIDDGIMKKYVEFKTNSHNYEKFSIDKATNDINVLLSSNSLDIYSKLDVIQAYRKLLRFITKISWIDGDISYILPQMIDYYINIKEFIDEYKKKGEINLCEVGFQLGAGALVMMLPDIKRIHLLGFSLDKEHSRKSFNYLSKEFNMKIEWGNSMEVIPNYNFNGIKCDIIHIDGCHSDECIKKDIYNLKSHVSKNNILFADDVNSNHPAWKEMKEKGIISEKKCYNYKPYCIGQYN